MQHGALSLHVPSDVHVKKCTPASWKQYVLPGAHAPVQAPMTHAWFVQGTAALQLPVASHVCTPLPEHCVAPGAHTPWHVPLAHAWLAQGTPAPHVPLVRHVCTALPEHCVVPGLHVMGQRKLQPWMHGQAHATGAPQWPVVSHVCSV
jgi:hypothetical protein